MTNRHHIAVFTFLAVLGVVLTSLALLCCNPGPYPEAESVAEALGLGPLAPAPNHAELLKQALTKP